MKKKVFTLLLALVAIATTGRAQNKINGHEYVDLGLPSGTLWATCNVGATKPEEYGDYFAWGETEPKDDYDFFKNYKYFDINIIKGFTKYTESDGKKELEQNDDAAYVKWGNSWRIPSYDQIIELYENCNFKSASLNGVNGYFFTSNKNGRSIFFPYSGYYDGNQLKELGTVGYLWTRTISMISTAGEDFAHTLYMSSNHSNMYVNHRYKGLAIRPVTDSSTTPSTDGSDDESGWQLVTDSGEKFPMSRVGMLVAVDESAYFSVLDTNGNVLADEVLRVHFVNSDPVSVENITTEKTQNILKRYVNNELTLVGANGTVNVYSVDGVKVATTYAAGQETIINVSSLPSGIYIVKCGNQSFKFNKK